MESEINKSDNSEEEGKESLGIIKVADEVIAITAGIATLEVPGVAGMSGGISGDIAELLKKKNLTKGVKVEAGDKESVIDLNIIVEYGSHIPQVATKVQNNVREAVRNITGLEVVEVNVNVQGIRIPSEEGEIKESQGLP